MHNPLTRHGFTLLELLIVCLLISISLVLSVPSLRNSLVSDQLAAGSRKIISLVKSARNKAVTTRRPYLILFDPTEQRLWYREADADDTEEGEPRGPSVTLPSGIRIVEIKQAGGGQKLDPAKTGIWISKQGYMDKTAIRLNDGSDKSLSLLVSPFLPTIKVLDEPVSFP